MCFCVEHESVRRGVGALLSTRAPFAIKQKTAELASHASSTVYVIPSARFLLVLPVMRNVACCLMMQIVAQIGVVLSYEGRVLLHTDSQQQDETLHLASMTGFTPGYAGSHCRGR